MGSSKKPASSAADGDDSKSSQGCYDSGRVSRGLRGGFKRLGRLVLKAPAAWLVGSIFVVLLCLIGIVRFNSESRVEKLWVPQESVALDHQAFFRRAWGDGVRVQSFLVATVTDVPEGEEFDAAEHAASDNIVTADVLAYSLELMNAAASVTVELDDETWKLVEDNRDVYPDLNRTVGLEDLCLPDFGELARRAALPPTVPVPDFPACIRSSALAAWGYLPATETSDEELLATLDGYLAGLSDDASRAAVVGGLTRAEDANETLQGVRAMSHSILLQQREVNLGGSLEDVVAGAWEAEWLKAVQDLGAVGNDMPRGERSVDNDIIVIPSSGSSFGDEFGRAIGGDISLFFASYVIIAFYLGISLGGCWCCIRRPSGPSYAATWHTLGRHADDDDDEEDSGDTKKSKSKSSKKGGKAEEQSSSSSYLTSWGIRRAVLRWRGDSQGKQGLIDMRVTLSLMTLVLVGLAVGGSIGFCSGIGLFYGSVQSVLPFLILGIGVDDVFIIVSAMQQETRLHPRWSLERRLVNAVGTAGASITSTSLTDALAFVIGSLTQLPALSTFSIYACVSILLLYILLFTFFVPVMYFDFKRHESRRADLLCCVAFDRNAPGLGGEGDGDDDDDDDGEDEDDKYPSCLAADTEKGARARQPTTHAEEEIDAALAGGILPRILGTVYARAVTSTGAAVAIVVACGCLAVVATVAATNLRQNFDIISFLPADSWLIELTEYQDYYFSTVGSNVNVVTVAEEFDHWENRDILPLLAEAADDNKWTDAGTVSSWYTEFDAWLSTQNATRVAAANASAAAWGAELRTFINAVPQGRQFAADVLFEDSEGGGVTDSAGIFAARMSVREKVLDGTAEQVAAMQTLRREIGDAAGGDVDADGNSERAWPFTFTYVLTEQYAVIEQEAIQNISLAMGVALVLVIATLGDLLLGAMTMLCIVMTLVDILGLMYVWGVDIDGVSVVNLVLAIGLAVDYSVHVAHAFAHASGEDRPERVRHALATMGSAILNGGISTFLAVLALAFSKSFIFIVFFKQFFGIVIFGLLHGMVFFPALLSLCGPASHKMEIGDDIYVDDAHATAAAAAAAEGDDSDDDSDDQKTKKKHKASKKSSSSASKKSKPASSSSSSARKQSSSSSSKGGNKKKGRKSPSPSASADATSTTSSSSSDDDDDYSTSSESSFSGGETSSGSSSSD